MIDVHPPEHTPHTWRDFFIHIATIVLGLVIAIGLEQTVEAIHHHEQVVELRKEMRGAFQQNIALEPVCMQKMQDFRTYLVELETAVKARSVGHPLAVDPDRNDPRMRAFTATPSLAPYDVAIQNGTIAYLPASEITLYNRVSKQRDYFTAAVDEWFHSITQMENFEKQFSNSNGNLVINGIVTTPDLSTLSPADLLTYRQLIASVINATDALMSRTIMLNTMGGAILDGVTTEDQLFTTIGKRINDNPWKKITLPHLLEKIPRK